MQKTKIYLAVNNATTHTAPLQVNVTTAVNSKQIRLETHNGREHYVIPSYTLPANVVMNRVLYPASEIDAHYKGLEGTLAPIGHPVVNGQHVSASSPEGLNVGYCGAWNRNVAKSGDRIYLEKWVDILKAEESVQGRRLLEVCKRAVAGEKVRVHTSVALFIDPQAAENPEYDNVARIQKMDHDAILLDEPGAATPEQGVGLMVNCSDAKALHVNEGAMQGVSFRQIMDLLESAAREKFVKSKDDFAYVADCTAAQVVVVVNGSASVYGYTLESGQITFNGDGEKVVQKTLWERAKQYLGFSTVQAQPATNQEKGVIEMPMTAEERAELARETATAVGAAMAGPLAELAANMKTIGDTLTANQRSEETAMRAVVADAHGEVVANALSGDALKQMHDSIKAAAAPAGTAAPVAPGVTANSQAPAQIPAMDATYLTA